MFRIKGTFKQNFRFTILILICMASSTCLASTSTDLDSLLQNIYNSSPVYEDTIEEYRAQLYVRAFLDIKKKNIIFRHIPHLLKTEKNVNQYLLETFSDIHYTYPNIYDQKIKAYTGTLADARELPGITDYFNINIYAPYLLGERLLSPLASNSAKYYRYVIDSVSSDSRQRLEYHIRFIPRNKSFQLIEGDMTVTEGAWSIRKMSFKGRSELLKFESHILMGDIGTDK